MKIRIYGVVYLNNVLSVIICKAIIIRKNMGSVRLMPAIFKIKDIRQTKINNTLFRRSFVSKPRVLPVMVAEKPLQKAYMTTSIKYIKKKMMVPVAAAISVNHTTDVFMESV